MCMWVELCACGWSYLACMCVELPDMYRWVELPDNSCHGDLTHRRGTLALTYGKMMQTTIHDCGIPGGATYVP